MSGMITSHLKALADFRGRETRREFWPFAGFVVAASAVANMAVDLAFAFAVAGPHRMALMIRWVGLLTIPVVLLLAAAVVRRLHDRGLSGAWGLLPLPFLGFAFFAMHRALSTAFADQPDSLFDTAFASAALYDVSIIVLIVLLAGRSDQAANRFGPGPDVR
jgi:uncharacterized membrane protein YhaH (DUF805 family)